MRKTEHPISKTSDTVVQEIKDEILIYDLKTNKVLCLNKTSAVVWNACDGTRSVEEITKKLKKDYDPRMTEDIVWLSLSMLESANLLASTPTNKFSDISRRNTIKAIGLASAVAFPIISALIAPTSLNAQSAGQGACICSSTSGQFERPGGCACATGSDCCSSACVGGICVSGLSVQSASCCPSAITCTCSSNVAQFERPGGCPCVTGSDCCSSACVAGVCVPGTSIQSAVCCP